MRAASVDLRALRELPRQAVEMREHGPQRDRQRDHRMRDDQRCMRSRQADIGKHDEPREQEQCSRRHPGKQRQGRRPGHAMPRDRERCRNRQRQPQERGPGRHVKAVQGVLEEIGAHEQLLVILERGGEQQLRRILRDIDPALEARNDHPCNRREKYDHQDDDLHPHRKPAEDATHYQATLRRNCANTSTAPNTMVERVIINADA